MATEKMDMETELEHLKKRKAELSRIENDLIDIASWFEKNDKSLRAPVDGITMFINDAAEEVSSAAWEVEDSIKELMQEMEVPVEAKTIESKEEINEPTD